MERAYRWLRPCAAVLLSIGVLIGSIAGVSVLHAVGILRTGECAFTDPLNSSLCGEAHTALWTFGPALLLSGALAVASTWALWTNFGRRKTAPGQAMLILALPCLLLLLLAGFVAGIRVEL